VRSCDGEKSIRNEIENKDSTFGILRTSLETRKIFVYGSLAGLILAVLQFSEVIARKSLGASEFQVTLFTMVMPITSLTSIWWGRLFVGRDQRLLLWITGLIGLVAIASGYFLGTFYHLYIMTVVFFLSIAVQIPARNRALQEYVPAKATGKIFGLSQGISMGLAAVISFGAGVWLDQVDAGWRQLYLGASIVGFVALFPLATVRTGKHGSSSLPYCRNWVSGPMQDVFSLLKRRPDFLRFQGAFMLYGIAFMMTLPVVPLYLVDDLSLSYLTIGYARGSTFQIVLILLIPLFGKWFDKSTPHRIAAIVFSIATLFPLLLISARHLTGIHRELMVILAFAVFGVAMGGVTVLWNIASMRFAGGKEDAGLYQSVHLTAVGIRGLFAPLIGYFVMQTLGKEITMMIASVFWLIAAGAMIAARKIDLKGGNAVSLRA